MSKWRKAGREEGREGREGRRTGGQGVHDGDEGQLEGVVEGGDDQDHAIRVTTKLAGGCVDRKEGWRV